MCFLSLYYIYGLYVKFLCNFFMGLRV
uniref:Uncharacterized protein n=1 Tax=Rhizophora mucronata TaxID=61149 RepID=A0A2P2K9M7_RHIMU